MCLINFARCFAGSFGGRPDDFKLYKPSNPDSLNRFTHSRNASVLILPSFVAASQDLPCMIAISDVNLRNTLVLEHFVNLVSNSSTE